MSLADSPTTLGSTFRTNFGGLESSFTLGSDLLRGLDERLQFGEYLDHLSSNLSMFTSGLEDDWRQITL